MSKRAATAAEKRHLDRLAKLPCAVCGSYGDIELHHPRFAVGAGQRASHWLAIPLCIPCHRGPQGLHGDRSRWRLYKMDEPKALAETICAYVVENIR